MRIRCLKIEMKFNLIWNAKMILTKLHSKFYLQELLQVFTDQNEKLERKNQDNQEARICKICMDEEVFFSKIKKQIKPLFSKIFLFHFQVSHILNPCNHAVCCNTCVKDIRNCPICRNLIHYSSMIYFS